MAVNKIEKVKEKVEKRLGKKLNRRTIENIFISLSEPLDFWELVGRSGELLVEVAPILRELEKLGYVELGETIRLTEKGKKAVEGLGKGKWICERCRGRRVVPFEDIRKEFERICRNRPKAVREFDQGYVTPEVTLARVAYMDVNADLRGREIIILGDDDLLSVAVGLTGLAKRIAVVEIDKRITDFIEKVANDYGFDVELLNMDLRKPLPEDFLKSFDVFETDPVENLPGLRMFLGRGIASVRDGGAGYFGLTRIESSREKWRKVQKMLLEMGAVITDIIPDFSFYENWDYYGEMRGFRIAPVKVPPRTLWYRSALYRIEVVKSERWNEEVRGNIYVDEETSTT